MSKEMKEPRSSRGFCWECGKQLWGNKCSTLKIDGHVRTLHVQCAKDIKNGKLDYREQDGEFFLMCWEPQ